jgi:hypothetical protein
MTMRSWLNPRASHHRFTPRPEPSKSKHRRRPSVEALEDRVVLSWLGQIGGPGTDFGGGSTTDSSGNLYDIEGRAGTTLVSEYTPQGGLLWSRSLAVSPSFVSRPFVDESSGSPSVYLTGAFSGSADLTGDGVTDVTSAGGLDVFILKLDASTGTVIWARSVGGGGDDSGTSITAAGGSVYLTGAFRDSADFDPGPNVVTLTATGKGKSRPADVFVLTLDAAGNYVKAWNVGSSDTLGDAGESIAVDGSTLHLAGIFHGSVDFDPGSGVVSRTSAGGTDCFFASYTISGKLNWVATIGGAGEEHFDTVGSMSSDTSYLYLAGTFTAQSDFDPGPGTAYLTPTGASDGFIAKYRKADGSLAWAKPCGDWGRGSAVDPATGDVYAVGYFAGMTDFDPGAGTANLISAGGNDGFLLKLAADGSYRNAWRMGGTGDDRARYICFAGTTAYVSGSFQAVADFPTGGSLTSQGDSDGFVMALDQATPQTATLSASPVASPTLQSASLSSSLGARSLTSPSAMEGTPLILPDDQAVTLLATDLIWSRTRRPSLSAFGSAR